MAYLLGLETPSGQKFSPEDLHLLSLMQEHGFVQYRTEPVILKSGIPSHVYVFGREDLTDHPELEWYVGLKIVQLVVGYHTAHADDWPDAQKSAACLIGMPTAGTALAQAAAMVAWRNGITMPGGGRICHRLMREVKKTHGAHQAWVNGPYREDYAFWGIDNVATDGQTKINGAGRLDEDGYPSRQMPWLIFVDRQQGALERLRSLGFERLVVGFNLLDLTYALGDMKLWPRASVRAVEEEIAAHQFR